MKRRLAALLAAAFIVGSCTVAIAQGAGGAPAAPKADTTPGGPSPNAMRGGSQHMKMMGRKSGMMKHRMHRHHMKKHHMMMHKKKMMHRM